MYNKPYPDWIDKLHPFPRGYKVLEFLLFLGEDKHQSSIEHVARFTVQCGEASANDLWRLRLFGNSLTKSAFTWYTHLPSHSITTWKDLEEKFHVKFYRARPDISLADLAKISQLPGEFVEQYIMRFRKLRT